MNGDAKSLTIAAASILAKTARDALMCKLDADIRDMAFRSTRAIPSASIVAALARLGASPVHRRSFAPVRTVLGLPPLPLWANAEAVSEGAQECRRPRFRIPDYGPLAALAGHRQSDRIVMVETIDAGVLSIAYLEYGLRVRLAVHSRPRLSLRRACL